jgi:hypothetical protein
MKASCHESRTLMPLLLMAASAMAQAVMMQAQTVNWYEVLAPSSYAGLNASGIAVTPVVVAAQRRTAYR